MGHEIDNSQNIAPSDEAELKPETQDRQKLSKVLLKLVGRIIEGENRKQKEQKPVNINKAGVLVHGIYTFREKDALQALQKILTEGLKPRRWPAQAGEFDVIARCAWSRVDRRASQRQGRAYAHRSRDV